MSNIQKIIYELELSLLRPEVRSSADKLNGLLADDFMEFGSSCLVYNKQNILERLSANTNKVTYTVDNFETKVLSDNIMLATFKTDRIINDKDKVVSMRSSLRRKENGTWKMFFHQGTPTK